MNEKVLEKIFLSKNIFLLKISKSKDCKILPGQFASIKTPLKDKILRRPFTVVKDSQKKLTFLIKVVGDSTEYISNLKKGDLVDIIYPLGKGFEEKTDFKRTLFIAGGIGIAAIIPFLRGKDYSFIFGDKEGEYENVLKYFSLKALYCHEKKNKFKGFATDFINRFDFDIMIGCGPKNMLKTLKDYAQKNGKKYFAIYEEVMACGVGLCNGCSVKTQNGDYIKICKEGPILNGNLIDYE